MSLFDSPDVPREPATMHAKPLLSWLAPAELLPADPDQRDRNTADYLRYFNNELRPDVRKRGVQVPLLAHDGRVFDGETRRLAALLEGVAQVPVLVYPQKLSTAEIEIAKFQANEKRLDLGPMDKARFYVAVMREKNWTQSQMCKELNLNGSLVSKQLKVLDKLIEELRGQVGEGKAMLSLRAAYAICDLTPEHQKLLGEKYISQAAGVEDLELEAAKLKGRKTKPKAYTFKQKVTTTVLTTDDHEAAIAEHMALIEAHRKCQKHSLPMSSVPQMLKTA